MRPARVHRHAEGLPRPAALEPPAGQDRAVGHRQEVAVRQGPELFQVPEAAAPPAGAAGIGREREPLDPEREARLGELDRKILAVRHDVDDVGPVRVVAAARAAPQHLTHQVELAPGIDPVEARVPDGLLVGRHPPAGGLGEHAGEDPEEAQDDERARVGRRREDRRQERAGRREP